MPKLLTRIRPQWQAKSLIERVNRLIHVDPSSACQRLFNAAIHDLREKIVIAGVDIAREAAEQYKLPPISKEEDVENYSTSKVIDLAYRMGLLKKAEWRRVCRSYEIRRDLEHEDNEYEAGIEDCVYIFTTCIEVILAVDPINLLKVTDIKTLVEQSSAAVPSEELLEDFERAPYPRQIEIMKFLISNALDKRQSDIIQQNAYTFLKFFSGRTKSSVIIQVAQDFQTRIGRSGLDQRHARVASASGVMPYLRQSARRDLFESYLQRLNEVGVNWTAHSLHGDLLREFTEIGGFSPCPDPPRKTILKWMALTYIGVPGGLTSYGNVRPVYYSNSAAPVISQLVEADAKTLLPDLDALRSDEDIQACCRNTHVARRFEDFVDLITGSE